MPYVKSLVLTGDNQGWPGLQRRDLQIYKYKTSFFLNVQEWPGLKRLDLQKQKKSEVNSTKVGMRLADVRHGRKWIGL